MRQAATEERGRELAPVWGVQFHPEHAGGPEDTNSLFTDFVEQVVQYKQLRGPRVVLPDASTQASAHL